MNYTIVHGVISSDARRYLLNSGAGEQTVTVTFGIRDFTQPFQKCKPIFWEVHFAKPVAANIFVHLQKNKEVLAVGKIKPKELPSFSGIKLYLEAETVILLPQFSMENTKNKKEVTENESGLTLV